MGETKFKSLFQPIQLGKVKLRNRIIMAPMGTNYANDDGTVSDKMMNYYEERARGGVGLIVVEGTIVDSRTGLVTGQDLCIDDDRLLPGLSQLASRIKQYGCHVGIQLAHGGSAAAALVLKKPGLQPVSPSGIPSYPVGPKPKVLSVEEIAELITCFSLAAWRAKEADFDIVELHGAHGVLISEFISPLYNKRTDEYGVTTEGRARFLVEILRSIKQRCGEDYPVIAKVNGEECEEGGLKIDEVVVLAQLLEKAGVDAIDVSYGTHLSPEPLAVAPAGYPQGTLLHLTEKVKQAVHIPTIAIGKIHTPDFAEKVLRDKKADLVALGRALICDPEWPNKAITGKASEIVPCIGCQRCLSALMYEEAGLNCSVNPAVGREKEYVITATLEPKKVIVIGGGPAGMEASRVAALRGHKVTLYEKEEELGGQLLPASKPPYKGDIQGLIDYFKNQIHRLPISVKTGVEFSPGMISEIEPDAVVLATGVIPFIPKIPGLNLGNVVSADQILSGDLPQGESAIIIGGGLVGCEIAELLAENGKKVTILEILPKIALKVEPITRALLLRRLREKGVSMCPGVKEYSEITAQNEMTFVNNAGLSETIKVDSIVLAAGAIPNNELARHLSNKVPQLYIIGDCSEPRDIHNAIHEGSAAGRQI